MVIKKGDFIELDYTAVVLEDGSIFDTTSPVDAEKAGMICDHNHDHSHGQGHSHVTKEDFKPIIICVGENHVLPGLEEQIIGLDVGHHDIILGEENAFGKKDAKLLKLMPLTAFKKQKINPFPGLVVDMDGSRGVVRSVSGGRVIVDFNHPLSGKSVKYQLNILRQVTDVKERIESVLGLARFPFESVVVNKDGAVIKVPVEIPDSLLDNFKKDLERITSTKMVFDIKKNEKESQNVAPTSVGDKTNNVVNEEDKVQDSNNKDVSPN